MEVPTYKNSSPFTSLTRKPPFQVTTPNKQHPLSAKFSTKSHLYNFSTPLRSSKFRGPRRTDDLGGGCLASRKKGVTYASSVGALNVVILAFAVRLNARLGRGDHFLLVAANEHGLRLSGGTLSNEFLLKKQPSTPAFWFRAVAARRTRTRFANPLKQKSIW